MSDNQLHGQIQQFKRIRARSRLVFLILVTLILVTTLSILLLNRAKTKKAEAEAKANRQSLAQLEMEAELASEMRTDRPLNSTEIMHRLAGEKQRRVIGIALDLHNQKPHIPYKWGGKSPTTGFDSSGFVAWTLNKAGLLDRPESYWSGALRQKLKSIPIDQRQPGDVLFYEGGPCMFFLGGPHNLSLGSLPGGLATGDLDRTRKPIAVGRY
jgi:cell wall-associated NlpC family hydrolase